jgi:hypothetical protein
MEYAIIMWLCSTVAGNDCRQIQTDIIEFKDHYECAMYGYGNSITTMKKLDKEFVNEYGAYTRFMCNKQEAKQEI